MTGEDEDIDAMALARTRLLGKGLAPGKTERRKREKQLRGLADGRSQRATGRTDQFNFKAREGLKERVAAAAKAQNMTIAEWMERAIEAALRGEK